jgi:hypothetical protein
MRAIPGCLTLIFACHSIAMAQPNCTGTLQAAGGGPLSMLDEALAYDPIRQRLVCHGQNEYGVERILETWEFDGLNWRRAAINPGVPANSIAMVFDPQIGRTLLFGVSPADPTQSETWSWDGEAWIRHFPAQNPRAIRPALVFDETRQRVLLFRGVNSASTWEWDGVNWTQITTATFPGNGSFPSATFDRSQGVTVLQTNIGTWRWDNALTDWVLLRWGSEQAAICFDEATGAVYSHTVPTRRWDWQTRTWESLGDFDREPPGGPMIYAANRGRMVRVGPQSLYGGAATMEYSMVARKWVHCPNTPGYLWQGAAAYDELREEVILFGGATDFSGGTAGTWAFDGHEWRELSPQTAPPERIGAGMAYDALRGRVVLFGGYGSSARLRDTWEWDGTNWLRAGDPVQGPSARQVPQLFFDTVRQRVLLVGGYLPNSRWAEDVWEWDASGHWVPLVPTTAIPARRLHFVYDPIRQHAIAVGTDGTTYRWDSHALSLTRVQHGFVTGGNGFNSPICLTFDTVRGCPVMIVRQLREARAFQWDQTHWICLGVQPAWDSSTIWDSTGAFHTAAATTCCIGGAASLEVRGYYHTWRGPDGPRPASILQGPPSSRVSERCTAVIHYDAVGETPLEFQWQYRGLPIQDGPSGLGGSTYHGTATPTLRIENVGPLDDDGSYSLLVSNLCMNRDASVSHRLFVAPRCPIDSDCSGRFDLPDLASVLTNFGTPGSADWTRGDSDEDGDVDLADVARLLAVFGATCP